MVALFARNDRIARDRGRQRVVHDVPVLIELDLPVDIEAATVSRRVVEHDLGVVPKHPVLAAGKGDGLVQIDAGPVDRRIELDRRVLHGEQNRLFGKYSSPARGVT